MSAPADITLAASASAIYGLSVGAAHSARYALHNVIKFPLLILGTAIVCAASYHIVARFLAPELKFAEVSALVSSCYRDISVLLASLSPICLFFAATFLPPSAGKGLGEYPIFLGLNVAFIALCGSWALLRQARALLRRHDFTRAKSGALVGLWLFLSLGVGAQWAWYLRPFFGNRAATTDAFCLGAAPDFRGDTSFYEAIFHLIAPPKAADATGISNR